MQSQNEGDLDFVKEISSYHKFDPIITMIYLMRGEKEKGLKHLENAIDDGSNFYLWINNSQIWDTYREDPEFKRILGKAMALHEEYLEKYPDVEL
jgi:hypothetical protein